MGDAKPEAISRAEAEYVMAYFPRSPAARMAAVVLALHDALRGVQLGGKFRPDIDAVVALVTDDATQGRTETR